MLEGRRAAREFATAAAESGLIVVSGLALGIVGIAHEAALAAGAAPLRCCHPAWIGFIQRAIISWPSM